MMSDARARTRPARGVVELVLHLVHRAATTTLLAIAMACCLWLPQIAASAPDEAALGKHEGYPRGTPSTFFLEPFRVGSFSGLDRILNFHTVRKESTVLPLPRANSEPSILYEADGKTLTVEDYLQRQRVTGLLLVKDGRIVLERYQYDRKETDRFTSFSMAKSITSLVVGLALRDGAIASLDDPASKYASGLAGTPYGETSIRNLLRMSSGVRFSENYSGTDDVSRFVGALRSQGTIEALNLFQDREAPAGSRFHYASSETSVLGLVVSSSTGKALADYVTERLWQPLGAEADATWLIDRTNREAAFAYFNAVLRDYGRLGWLLANDGALNGRQILPREYLIEATDWHKHPEPFRPGQARPYFGYGYQFWTFPGEGRCFALMGIYGQVVFVDPISKLVLVQTAVTKEPTDATIWKDLLPLWQSVRAKHGEW